MSSSENKDSSETNETHQASWPEKNVGKIVAGLIAACVLTIIAQLLCGPVFPPLFDEHHPAHFDVENIPGFQAMFGFAAFVIIVYLGRFLRLIVMRKEGYYDS